MPDITLKPLLTEGNGEQYIIVNMGAEFKNKHKYYNSANSFSLVPAANIWVDLNNATRFRKLNRLNKAIEVLKTHYPLVEAMPIKPKTPTKVRAEDDIYPLTVIADRYQGAYSKGAFTAWNLHEYEVPKETSWPDVDCKLFWAIHKGPVGLGGTVKEAIKDLHEKLKK